MCSVYVMSKLIPILKLREGTVFSHVCQSVCSGRVPMWSMPGPVQTCSLRDTPISVHLHLIMQGPLHLGWAGKWSFGIRPPSLTILAHLDLTLQGLPPPRAGWKVGGCASAKRPSCSLSSFWTSLHIYVLYTHNSYQGQIQDSPYEGAPTYKFSGFSQKLHEIKKILVRRGLAPGGPPWIRHYRIHKFSSKSSIL